MGIIVNLDVVMAKRKIGSGELAEKIGITQANLSILKTGKAKAVRFSTLEKLIFWNMPPTLSLKITKVTKGTVSHE